MLTIVVFTDIEEPFNLPIPSPANGGTLNARKGANCISLLCGMCVTWSMDACPALAPRTRATLNRVHADTQSYAKMWTAGKGCATLGSAGRLRTWGPYWLARKPHWLRHQLHSQTVQAGVTTSNDTTCYGSMVALRTFMYKRR